MSQLRDLLGVAWSGLKARKVRTLMIMLGPVIGVAAMVERDRPDRERQG